ncbi:MAG: LacI family DNA-binding transcriptional regulator [Bacillota bacterium]
MRKKKAVSLQVIADRLGISKFSVSKALSGKPGVGEETRQKVLALAKQLGYSTRRGDEQGVILLLLSREATQEPAFWPSVLMGIHTEVNERGTSVVMAPLSEEDQAALKVPPAVDHVQVRGIICLGVLSEPYLKRIHGLGYPMVLVDHQVPTLPVDAVMADNFAGGSAVAHHLADLGHRNVGFVGASGVAPSFDQRWLGFREGADAVNLNLQPEWRLMQRGPHGRPWDGEWLRTELQRLQEWPTAWFCVNDLTALTLQWVASELGHRVPEDLSIIGFDDIHGAERSVPPLSTVRVHKEALGIRGVERLYERINRPDQPPDLTLIRTELVARNSVAALC